MHNKADRYDYRNSLGFDIGICTAVFSCQFQTRSTPTPGQPISLQLPNINATKPLLQIGNSLDMAASNGRLEPVSYPIPNTQMTLDIISDPDVSLWPSR